MQAPDENRISTHSFTKDGNERLIDHFVVENALRDALNDHNFGAPKGLFILRHGLRCSRFRGSRELLSREADDGTQDAAR